VGLALRERQRDLRRMNRIGNSQSRRRHAGSNLRAQSTTSHPANRTLKKREDSLSTHRWGLFRMGYGGAHSLSSRHFFAYDSVYLGMSLNGSGRAP
jgi:hypothetical protein